MRNIPSLNMFFQKGHNNTYKEPCPSHSVCVADVQMMQFLQSL